MTPLTGRHVYPDSAVKTRHPLRAETPQFRESRLGKLSKLHRHTTTAVACQVTPAFANYSGPEDLSAFCQRSTKAGRRFLCAFADMALNRARPRAGVRSLPASSPDNGWWRQTLKSWSMSTPEQPRSNAGLKPPMASSEPRRMLPGGLIATIAILILVGGAVAIWLVPPLLAGLWASAAPTPSPTPATSAPAGAAVTWVAAQTVLFAIGGAIAILGFALSFARHQDERRAAIFDLLKEETRIAELAQRRTDDKEVELSRRKEAEERQEAELRRDLRARFSTAVELLAADVSVTKRLSGIHALTALTDDWLALTEAKEARTCVEVVCAYLRSPLSEDKNEPSVRSAGLTAITRRLQNATEDGPGPWSHMRFDLHGMPITTHCSLDKIHLIDDGLIDLSNVSISGENVTLSLSGLHLGDYGTVTMVGAVLGEDTNVFINEGVQLTGKSMLLLNKIRLEDGATLSIDDRALVTDSATIAMSDLELRGGTLRVDADLHEFCQLSIESLFAHSGEVHIDTSIANSSNLTLDRLTLAGTETSITINPPDLSKLPSVAVIAEGTSVTWNGVALALRSAVQGKALDHLRKRLGGGYDHVDFFAV